MSEKEKFSLADYIKAAVPEMDTGRKQIEYIDIDLIDEDARNFYTLDGLDELASNIALFGVMDPLIVRSAPDGRVVVTSGHRRRAAVRKLVESGDESRRLVPCIRDDSAVLPELQELQLIFANNDTRKMTSADISRQAERVEQLLYELKEKGFEFPGRMRDHVAAACDVSKSKLARLKVIREDLDAHFKEQWLAGDLTESAAYAISRLQPKTQKLLAEGLGKHIVTSSVAEEVLKNEEMLLSNHERHHCKNGATCQNTRGFLIGAARTRWSWDACDGTKCCMDCSHSASCQGKCQNCKDKLKREKLKMDKEKEKREAEDQKRQLVLRRDIVACASRILKAIDAAGLKDDDVLFQKYGYDKYTVKRIRKDASDDFKEGYHFYSNTYQDISMRDLANMACMLHCSADYLLGLSDELKPMTVAVPGSDTEPMWQTGEPHGHKLHWCRFNCEGVIIRQKAIWNAMMKHWEFSPGVKIDAECECWYPLPED